jgi:predicted LPLAT superfamily acyltransferase
MSWIPSVLRRRDQALQNFGGRYGIDIFHFLIRFFGIYPSYALLSLVVPYYVICRPKARRLTYSYLDHRFPAESKFLRFLRTFPHIFNYAQILIDQAALGVLGTEGIIDFPKMQHLIDMSTKGRGLVLVTAHVGNFLGAIATSKYLPAATCIILDTQRYRGNHFFDLSRNQNNFEIIEPSMTGLVQATNALKSGKVVVMMGDRAYNARRIRLPFLGDDADFPITPYHLAMTTGSDIAVLFTVRTGKLKYYLEHEMLAEDQDWGHISREEAVKQLAEKYVRALECYVRRFPYMWYNFYNFWSINPNKETR